MRQCPGRERGFGDSIRVSSRDSEMMRSERERRHSISRIDSVIYSFGKQETSVKLKRKKKNRNMLGEAFPEWMDTLGYNDKSMEAPGAAVGKVNIASVPEVNPHR